MGQELGHVLAALAAARPTGNATVTALGVLEPREVDQGRAVGAGGPPLPPGVVRLEGSDRCAARPVAGRLAAGVREGRPRVGVDQPSLSIRSNP